MANYDPIPFSALAQTLDALRNPQDYEWTIQGFGMLRTKFNEGTARLHIWLPRELRVDEVSDIHNHPWSFTSMILAGQMKNVRFLQSGEDRAVYNLIQCGPEAHIKESSIRPIKIDVANTRVYNRGETYWQYQYDLHKTVVPEAGAVSLISRTGYQHDCDEAISISSIGQDWVSAKPQDVGTGEVLNLFYSYRDLIEEAIRTVCYEMLCGEF